MGKRVLITAGPTREPIDAVRFIANRSSGRMGLAMARAAADAGHEVVLLLGPIGAFEVDSKIMVHRYETTQQLQALLTERQVWFDLLVMAAAVADYRVVNHQGLTKKIERKEEGGKLVLELEPTPDLVAEVCRAKRSEQRVVAFALEEAAKLRERAVEKMRRKGVDAIVANPLETMDAEAIDGTLFWADGRSDRAGVGSRDKLTFAQWLVERVAE